MPAYTPASQSVIDYDHGDYDYRNFWKSRQYEDWSESRVLARIMGEMGYPGWFADFGGGFGRNAAHYRHRAAHSVIVDYSAGNLERAGQMYATDVAAGRIHLVRGNVNALPFVDGAFESAMVVRVLHHLADAEGALTEMGRTIQDSWLVDVPIKHHALGRLRSVLQGQWRQMRSPEPLVRGTSMHPFHAFRLPVVRRQLSDRDWESDLVASVNNFRRWDQVCPRPVVTGLRPLVKSLEVVAQNAGRGWWGPSQFLVATRRVVVSPELRPVSGEGLSPTVAEFAKRVVCPECHGTFYWGPDNAACAECRRTYRRHGPFWDFVA
jgi:ubiquinone/menaquinone biosynthesis C-methylase UbiE